MGDTDECVNQNKARSLCNGGTKVVRPRLGAPSARVSPKSLPESVQAPPWD